MSAFADFRVHYMPRTAPSGGPSNDYFLLPITVGYDSDSCVVRGEWVRMRTHSPRGGHGAVTFTNATAPCDELVRYAIA